MKRIVLILGLFLAITNTVCAQSMLEEKISVDFQDQNLESALYVLIEEFGLKLSFRNDLLPDRTFNQSFRRVELRVILDLLLRNTNIAYEEIGQQIVLFQKIAPITNQSFTISGFIRDESNGERLNGATVYETITGNGAISNEYGFFSLTITGGAVNLNASFLGFQPTEIALNLQEDLLIQVDLSPSITLREVVVEANYLEQSNPFSDLKDGISINIEETLLLPSLAGEPDILRTALLLPGIHTGTDGAEGMHIRGGNAGQNMILMDGVPIYNVGHAIGLFSIFNTSSVRSADLIKGGFPARYGGRLSGVLDIRIKEGNLQRFVGEASTGLLSSKFSLEGPIIKDKSSFFVAGRRSFVHWLLRDQSKKWKVKRGNKGVTDYGFYDFNAKLNHTFSPKNRVYLSLYNGSDDYFDQTERNSFLQITSPNGDQFSYQVEQDYEEGIEWGNIVGAFRWNHIFNDKLFANLSLTYSELAVDAHYDQSDSLRELTTNQLLHFFNKGAFSSGIKDIGARMDMHYLPKPMQEWRAGFGLNSKNFKPGALEIDEEDEGGSFVNSPILTTSYFAYVEGRGMFRENWSWNIGLHSAFLQVRNTSYSYLQPRLNIARKVSERTSIRFTSGQMVQFSQLLSNSSIGLPLELWVPATDRIQPAQAWSSTLGVVSRFSDNWQIDVDLYHKKMRHLLTFREGANSFRNWEENVTAGKGMAYGAEFQLSKTRGRLTGWLAYTLAWSNRQFELVNSDEEYPFKFDRRHDVKVVGIYKIKKGWSVSANWIYSTGFAFTIPLIKYRVELPGVIIPGESGIEILDPEGKNQNRMPAYHRFDISTRFEWERNKLQHTLSAGLYNAYNRKNPLYYDIRRSYQNIDNDLVSVRQFVEAPFAPILPTFSYSITF